MKDKLIEVLESVECYQRLYPDVYVDHLIANGVTVQRWIPVTERLPEIHEEVLVYRSGDGICLDSLEKNGLWELDLFTVSDLTQVTHWMPLPQPPEDGAK